MRAALVLLALLVAACTPPDADRAGGTSRDLQPSVTEPGVHVSGSATIGIKKRF